MSRVGSDLVCNDHYVFGRCVRGHHSQCELSPGHWSDQDDRKSCTVAHSAPSSDWTGRTHLSSMACEMGRMAARCIFVVLGRCTGCRIASNLECEDFLLHSHDMHYNALDWPSAPIRSRGMFFPSGIADLPQCSAAAPRFGSCTKCSFTGLIVRSPFLRAPTLNQMSRKLEVCQLFCVNDRGLVFGMGARGKGQHPFPRPAT